MVQVDHRLCQSYLVIYLTPQTCHIFMKRMIVNTLLSVVYCRPQGEERSQFEQYSIKTSLNTIFIEEAELEMVNYL